MLSFELKRFLKAKNLLKNDLKKTPPYYKYILQKKSIKKFQSLRENFAKQSNVYTPPLQSQNLRKYAFFGDALQILPRK